MKAGHPIIAALGGISAIGLGLIASGLVSWGVRALALLTLFGLGWLFLLFVRISVELHQRTTRD